MLLPAFHKQPLGLPWDAPAPYMLGTATQAQGLTWLLRLKHLLIAKTAKMKQMESQSRKHANTTLIKPKAGD